MKEDNIKGTARLAYGVREDSCSPSDLDLDFYAMMKAGTLRFTKVGNRTLIPTDALLALIEP